MDDSSGRLAARRPGDVPESPSGIDAARGIDTDGDGVPDTVLSVDGADLLVQTDLDVDGLVDRVLRIGADGAVRAEPPVAPDDPVTGSAPASWPGWSGLLGRLLGPDP